jgi:hypothetical protein
MERKKNLRKQWQRGENDDKGERMMAHVERALAHGERVCVSDG